MQQVASHDIGPFHIVEGESEYEVGLSALKGLCGHIPLLHHITVGDVQTVEDDVKHLDVIAVRLAFVVAELIGRELPIADNHEWLILRIFMYLLGGKSEE